MHDLVNDRLPGVDFEVGNYSETFSSHIFQEKIPCKFIKNYDDIYDEAFKLELVC